MFLPDDRLEDAHTLESILAGVGGLSPSTHWTVSSQEMFFLRIHDNVLPFPGRYPVPVLTSLTSLTQISSSAIANAVVELLIINADSVTIVRELKDIRASISTTANESQGLRSSMEETSRILEGYVHDATEFEIDQFNTIARLGVALMNRILVKSHMYVNMYLRLVVYLDNSCAHIAREHN